MSEKYSITPIHIANTDLSWPAYRFPRSPFETYRFLSHSILTLFQGKQDVDSHRAVYAEVKGQPLREPLNREFDLVHNIIKVINKRNVLRPDASSLSPYWDMNIQYKPLEVFGTLIQFLDYHKTSLPLTVLPPQQDVERYVKTILLKEGRVVIDQQLDELLDITRNNLLGAANLGFIASRIFGRGLDCRAYPNLDVNDNKMLEWGSKVAQFEYYTGSNGDSAGDTYYFWTHLFAGLFYNIYGKNKFLYQTTFENGTALMVFVRQWVARLPTTSDHFVPSLLGRRIGLTLSEPDWYSLNKNHD